MEKDRPVNLINSFNLIFNQQLDEWTNERDEWNEWFERTKKTVKRWSWKNKRAKWTMDMKERKRQTTERIN